MHVAVLGLGEAGRAYARDLLAAGVTVSAYDPDAEAVANAIESAPGLLLADSEDAAVADAELVISLVTAACATGALEAVLRGRSVDGRLFADLNTTSPDLKAALAEAAAGSGVAFADVAVMAPVARAGLRTPLLVSGAGAAHVSDMLRKLDVPVEDAGEEAGAAARLKLLRSVFMKGLAGLVLEGLTAAARTGRSESIGWMRDQMAAELGPDGAAFVDHLVESTLVHAGRRAHEMDDVAAYLDTLGTPGWMTAGTRSWLHALAAGEVDAPEIPPP
ncbi:hypothetical protein GCM10023169_00630 [Georgenia halophila]|uniref:3-hydroxyisobutyrate dehydrogenase-like beta-hydroxyacid dehydrogenase n=1 Tax=Georgenia halophila TaxID=620889 RepID=A0ABP8KSR4_9MICO